MYRTRFAQFGYLLTYSFLFYRYKPVVRDAVHVTAIESNAGGEDFMWRAISIVPNSKNTSACSQHHGADQSITTEVSFQDVGGISVERENQFGLMEIGSEKEIRIKIVNASITDISLLSAKFLNFRSNFEIRNQSLPVVLSAANGQFYLELYFK